ncbi:MAG: hypothetical protein AAFQ07_16650, partial [Chloroflexota bacterium]
MKRFTALCLFSVLLSPLLIVGNVHACTDINFPPILDNLTHADTIVRGTIIDVDDVGFSAIVQVDTYFEGSGAEHIVVMRYRPALQTTRRIRQYTTGCLYAGGGAPMREGATAYFGLISDDYGTYRDVEIFYVEDETVAYMRDLPEIRDIYSLPGYVSTSTEEFEARLTPYVAPHTPIEPDTDARFPLMRYAQITTESGQRYRLNPDYSVTPLSDTFAYAMSPDGAHVVFQQDMDTFLFNYYVLDYENIVHPSSPNQYYIIKQQGDELAFSPDSNFVAVWDSAGLELYMFHNQERGGYGQAFSMTDIGQITWQTVNPQVMWSGDSSTLIFVTDVGIWSWDIY